MLQKSCEEVRLLRYERNQLIETVNELKHRLFQISVENELALEGSRSQTVENISEWIDAIPESEQTQQKITPASDTLLSIREGVPLLIAGHKLDPVSLIKEVRKTSSERKQKQFTQLPKKVRNYAIKPLEETNQ